MERIHMMELPPFSKGRQPSSKGDNLCDFLFAFLATKFHLKTRKHQKGRKLLPRNKFFPLNVDCI